MREYEICVTSELVNLPMISEFVSERARAAGMDEDRVFEVEMAVDEACTNAMQHAYGGRDDGEVRICCYTEGDDFVVRVVDQGEAFDPAQVPEPKIGAPLQERRIGGLGLYLMRRLMDRVEYTSGPEGNQVVMYKHREAAA